jgi:hypothetical protein
MQAPSAIISKLDLTGDQPTVGVLMALCEENYRALMQLVPRLASLSGVQSARTYLSAAGGHRAGPLYHHLPADPRVSFRR